MLSLLSPLFYGCQVSSYVPMLWNKLEMQDLFRYEITSRLIMFNVYLFFSNFVTVSFSFTL